mgnify:CR=1 FL=1
MISSSDMAPTFKEFEDYHIVSLKELVERTIEQGNGDRPHIRAVWLEWITEPRFRFTSFPNRSCFPSSRTSRVKYWQPRDSTPGTTSTPAAATAIEEEAFQQLIAVAVTRN